MGTVLTLAAKDLRLLFRDKFALFWIFAFPLMYAGFFGVIFGNGGDDGARGQMSLAIVDDDRSEASAALIGQLAGHESVRVDRIAVAVEGAAADGTSDPPDGADPGGAPDASDPVSADARDPAEAPPVLLSLEDASAAVRKGHKTAYLRIPAGYGDSPFAMFGPPDDQEAIEVGIDPRRAAEAGMLQGVLMQAVFGGMSDRMADKDAMAAEINKSKQAIAEEDDLAPGQKLVLQSFMSALGVFLNQIDTDVLAEGPGGGFGGDGFVEVVDVARESTQGPSSSFDITLPSAMIWGLMSVAMSFAITLVRERTQGTLLRLKVAPIGRTQILAGKAVSCFVMCLTVMVFLLVVGVVALGVRVGSYPLLVLALASTAACFTGLMMVCATMGKTEEAVAGTTWGIMMPFAMVGGGMIPLIAMPSWLLTVSNVSPFKWGILAVEGAVWRGFTLADMALPCLILVAIGIAFFLLGATLFRRIGLGV